MKHLATTTGLLLWATAACPLLAQVPLPEVGALQGVGISILTTEVTVSVAEINVISVSASTATLTITDGVEAVDNSTTYSITVNGTSKKLSGAIDADFSGSLSLDVELAAPSGAVSSRRTLNTSAQDLVTGINLTADADLGVTYYGNADESEPANGAGETRTVTITLTDS